MLASSALAFAVLCKADLDPKTYDRTKLEMPPNPGPLDDTNTTNLPPATSCSPVG